MPTPIKIKVIPQKAEADCGVACLAALLDIPYEDVYVEIAKIDRWRSKRGLYLSQIKKAATRLGSSLQMRRVWDDDATGILSVDVNGCGHVVILFQGVILETDGTLWDYDTYLAVHKAIAKSLLVLKD